jgi:hypothetical protein
MVEWNDQTIESNDRKAVQIITINLVQYSYNSKSTTEHLQQQQERLYQMVGSNNQTIHSNDLIERSIRYDQTIESNNRLNNQIETSI